jgi:hypothetical protein
MMTKWQLLKKDMTGKKGVHLQQFDIIHKSRSKPTSEILREKQNYVFTLPPLENLNQEPEKKQNYFYTLPPLLIRKDAPR